MRRPVTILALCSLLGGVLLAGDAEARGRSGGGSWRSSGSKGDRDWKRHHHAGRAAIIFGAGVAAFCCGPYRAYPYGPPYYYGDPYAYPYSYAYPPVTYIERPPEPVPPVVTVEPIPAPAAAPPDTAPPPAVAPEAVPPVAAAEPSSCRVFASPIIIEGQTLRAGATACRQPDGSWKPAPDAPKQKG